MVDDAPIRPTIPLPEVEAPPPLHFQVEVKAVQRQGDTVELALERAGTIYTDHRFTRRTNAMNHARNLLSTFPGARVALAHVDSEQVMVTVKEDDFLVRTTAPISVTAAAMHWWSTVPSAQRPAKIHVRCGAVEGTVVITPVDRSDAAGSTSASDPTAG